MPVIPSGPIQAEDLAEYLKDAMDVILVAPMQPALQKCVDFVREQVTQQFETETDPEGIAWPEWHWDSDYPAEDHQTLDKSGFLKQSFIGHGAGHVEEIGDRELIFGSELNYASIHDLGATITLGIWLFGRHGGALKPGTLLHIPQRQIAGWSEKTLEQCDEAILDYFEQEIFG